MTEDEYFEPDFQVEYYLLDDQALARVWYDVDADEYFDGEVLGEDGRWQDSSAEEIMHDGEEISYEEASQRARAVGGIV